MSVESCRHGEIPAVLLGAFYHDAAAREEFPAVGDFVLVRYNEQGESGIAKVLPRKSKFSRTDFSGRGSYAKTVYEQVVATNFDYVFIVVSLNRDFNLNRISRYLTASWQSGGLPVIILSKADLMDDYSEPLELVKEAAPFVPVVVLSCLTGLGLDDLTPYLEPGKTIVFLGSSGVGKSSLLNRFCNGPRATTEIEDFDRFVLFKRNRVNQSPDHRRVMRDQLNDQFIEPIRFRIKVLFDVFHFSISHFIQQFYEKIIQMQARFIHDGKAVDFFPTSDVPAGSVVIQGSLVGITKLDAKANSLGAVAVVGVFDVVKSNAAIPLGTKVYWDETAKKAVTTATGNTLLGVAVLGATADDTVVRVRIG